MQSQVDDGYASDEIMLHQPLSILTFTNTTRLMQNVPCPFVNTPADTTSRQKVGSNMYKFPYRPQKYVGCAGGPGDLFVVCPSASFPGHPCEYQFDNRLELHNNLEHTLRDLEAEFCRACA